MDVHEWVATYFRAWNERDADAAAAIFTDDATYRSHPMNELHEGRDAIRAYWAGATSAQERIDARHGTPIVDGAKAAVEWWTTLLLGGAETTVAGILVLRFADDGRCAELRETYNFEPGILPMPERWGRF